MSLETYYDEDYYKWQETFGKFGGVAELIKFSEYVGCEDNVVDFGCGGGFLLTNLTCKGKLGVEINPVARDACKELGIDAVADINDIPKNWADVIISNHALEHVSHPLAVLHDLKQRLKDNGIIVFVVPCERVDTQYLPCDVNQHLYTWSPANLGNLFVAAGFSVIECKPFLHRWIPKFYLIQPITGWKLFHLISWCYGYIFRRTAQTRVIATNKA
jgi:SAM-dependent methyltransferase